MYKLIIFFSVIGSFGKLENACAKNHNIKLIGIYPICLDDTNLIRKNLPMYQVIPCIDNLLKQVVKANNKFYDCKKYFYSLSFRKEGIRRYLVIEPVQYKSSRVLDYVGAIKGLNSIFLCRGNITTDTLFKRNDNKFLNVYLKRKEDSNEFNFGLEPSLRGLYQECKEIKIYLEIYTHATLPGYKMHERKK